MVRYGALAKLALFAAGISAAHGQQTPSPPAAAKDGGEVAPRGARAARDIKYGEWKKLCFNAAGAKTLCRTTITGTFGTGQTAVRLDLIEREDGSSRVQLFLPVGMYLQAGVKLSVDQKQVYRLPYTWCATNMCIAADVADPKLLEDMDGGKTLSIEVVDTSILTMTTSVPLDRFASVRKGAPALTLDQVIDE
ncbi:invasion associated locus B family protein [Bradyrhizobium pachyrhizi]|uniref:Invasion associated locus B family protein n=1 Tax=Bradyrhizobium pachyrhizi TaxID=280333 RepID=A0A844SV16_9BRAD|nr:MULTISPECIES: invasion associated locus B family protein [Bradyrhizobium]MVT66230.1 invasion associated locus B family protein [Bradyrhizobium pachyrhizi]WFU57034.1 invasion associated locus B family protein [Bradyrhizobium pachyrhizi]WOH84527.1 invasion associated locus B family protein [Bradyrhizobium sp. BEA-2-5]